MPVSEFDMMPNLEPVLITVSDFAFKKRKLNQAMKVSTEVNKNEVGWVETVGKYPGVEFWLG